MATLMLSAINHSELRRVPNCPCEVPASEIDPAFEATVKGRVDVFSQSISDIFAIR
jgi:hypothetical protein